jgi:hypothetical protein
MVKDIKNTAATNWNGSDTDRGTCRIVKKEKRAIHIYFTKASALELGLDKDSPNNNKAVSAKNDND